MLQLQADWHAQWSEPARLLLRPVLGGPWCPPPPLALWCIAICTLEAAGRCPTPHSPPPTPHSPPPTPHSPPPTPHPPLPTPHSPSPTPHSPPPPPPHPPFPTPRGQVAAPSRPAPPHATPPLTSPSMRFFGVDAAGSAAAEPVASATVASRPRRHAEPVPAVRRSGSGGHTVATAVWRPVPPQVNPQEANCQCCRAPAKACYNLPFIHHTKQPGGAQRRRCKQAAVRHGPCPRGLPLQRCAAPAPCCRQLLAEPHAGIALEVDAVSPEVDATASAIAGRGAPALRWEGTSLGPTRPESAAAGARAALRDSVTIS